MTCNCSVMYNVCNKTKRKKKKKKKKSRNLFPSNNDNYLYYAWSFYFSKITTVSYNTDPS